MESTNRIGKFIGVLILADLYNPKFQLNRRFLQIKVKFNSDEPLKFGFFFSPKRRWFSNLGYLQLQTNDENLLWLWWPGA